MAEGRGRHSWGQTSELLALIANVNRNPKKRAVKASEVNPYTARERRDTTIEITDMAILRNAFERGR
jgi:hypothetical protein